MAKRFFTTGTCTGTLEIMMAKGLFTAGTLTGTQDIMMAKGLFSAGTCGPEPANHSQSWWQRVSEAPEPLPEPGNHDGKGSLKRRNLYENPRNHGGKGSL